MNRGLIGFLAGTCIGAAAVYLASGRGATAPPEVPTPHKSTSAGSISAPGQVAPEARRTPGAATVRPPDRIEAATEASTSPDTDPGSQDRPLLALPGGKLVAQRTGDAAPLDKLLNSISAWCQFDAGAGGQWPHGKVLAHGAAWQGGPLEFDAINLVDQTAQMTRNPWTPATPEGIPLRATATNTGLHLSGFKPDGELIVVTVFGALDSDARHMAVVSLHGTNLDHESAQFYGWCTVR